MKTTAALLLSASALGLLTPASQAAPTVGVAAAVNQSAESTQPGAGTRTVTLGDNVIHNEHIVTGPDGLVNILLVDGTSFTVGANSDLTIDKFVYDPDAGTAEVAATLTKGALRFIGGRTSKTGGASIDTPVGTVGIRGGMTDIILGQTTPGVPPNLVNCVFGTCNVGGTTFQAGQSAYPNPNGGMTVVTTTAAMAAAGTNQVGSSEGKTGGAPAGTSSAVASTAEENDDIGDSGDPPPSTPPADYSSSGSGGTTTDTEENVVQDATPPVVVPPTPPAETPPNDLALRVFMSPSVYETSWGGLIPDSENEDDDRVPALLGLVGGPEGFDQTVTLTFSDQPNSTGLFAGSDDLTVAPVTGALVLPARLAPTFASFATSADSISPFSPLGFLSGTYYLLTDGFDIDFAFYDLVNDGGTPQRFVAIGGTPTDFEAAFTGDNLRTYSFSMDELQGVPVPFFQRDIIDSFAGAAIGDFQVIESPDLEDQHARLFQAWLQISGTGANQQSAIGVTTGNFEIVTEGNDYGFRSGRRGGYRASADSESMLFYGPLNSVADSDGEEIFGPDGNNFVLSSDIPGADPFGDNGLNSGSNFNSVHVLNLVDDDAPLGPQSLDGSYFGFASGMVEESRAGYGGISVSSMFSDVPYLGEGEPLAGIRIDFNAGGNTLGGDLTIADIFDTSTMQALRLSFGDGFDHQEGDPFGTSVYIDDDHFAANTQGDDEGQFTHSFGTRDDDVDLVYADGEHPVTFIVSSGAVDLGASPAFMNGAEICDCSFAEWGWWGAQPRLAEPGNSDEEVLAQSIFLGNWVAGEILDDHDLQTGVTATYTGHAIGTVLSIDQNDGEEGNPGRPILTQYIAGGSVALTWDFTARQGDIAFNFDGKTFGGIVTDPGEAGALFSGSLYGDQLAGSVNGAIVSSDLELNAGIVGNFGVYGVNYAATGVIVGENTPSAMPVTFNASPLSFDIRVLTSGSSFTPHGQGDALTDPASLGLVGDGEGSGETGHDTITQATLGPRSIDINGTTYASATFTVGADTFVLPFELTNSSYYSTIDESFLGGDMDGTVYYGPGAFAAYLTNYGGELFYAVTGIPTNITPAGGSGVFQGDAIRAYQLWEDPVQQLPVPFMRDVQVYDSDLDEYVSAFTWDGGASEHTSSPLYVVDDHNGDDGFSPHYFQAWLTIQGSGTDQVSAIGLEAATIYNDPDNGVGYGINSGRRGSFRAASDAGFNTMGGGISTLGGTNAGANQFFGPNANNFVIGAGGFSNGDSTADVGQVIGDWSLDPDAVPGAQYGAVHVATLYDTDTRDNESNPVGVDRTTRDLTGFAAGLIDVAYQTGCNSSNDCSGWSVERNFAVRGGGEDGGGIALHLDAEHDRLGGSIMVGGTIDGEPGTLTLQFGWNADAESGNGKSTFVDDNIFGAREATDRDADGNPISNAEAEVDGVPLDQRTGDGANTYVVSSGAVPLENADFMNGASCGNCDFMKWGWWGTNTRFADPAESNDSVHMASHLGTWVAGDIPDPDDLPITGTATYNGQAVGNVVSAGATYVAGGQMQMDWDFAARQGSWNVTDFDSHDFGGTVDSPVDSSFFAGSVTGAGGVTGSVSGAFAANGGDPVAGVMGSFGVDNGVDWSATGTFMGSGGIGQ